MARGMEKAGRGAGSSPESPAAIRAEIAKRRAAISRKVTALKNKLAGEPTPILPSPIPGERRVGATPSNPGATLMAKKKASKMSKGRGKGGAAARSRAKKRAAGRAGGKKTAAKKSARRMASRTTTAKARAGKKAGGKKSASKRPTRKRGALMSPKTKKVVGEVLTGAAIGAVAGAVQAALPSVTSGMGTTERTDRQETGGSSSYPASSYGP